MKSRFIKKKLHNGPHQKIDYPTSFLFFENCLTSTCKLSLNVSSTFTPSAMTSTCKLSLNVSSTFTPSAIGNDPWTIIQCPLQAWHCIYFILQHWHCIYLQHPTSIHVFMFTLALVWQNIGILEQSISATPIDIPTYLPIDLPTYLPAYLLTYLLVDLLTYLFTHLITYLFIYTPTHWLT